MKILLHYVDGSQGEAKQKTYAECIRVRDERREKFSPGERVKLVALAQTPNGWDDRRYLPPGTEGVVQEGVTDDMGSLLVSWENGSSLNATADDVVARVAPRE